MVTTMSMAEEMSAQQRSSANQNPHLLDWLDWLDADKTLKRSDMGNPENRVVI